VIEKDLNDYLSAIFRDHEGHLCIAVGLDPYRDENGKYKHHKWSEVAFVWPSQTDKAVTFIDKAAALGDVYLTPYLMKQPKRSKGSATQRVLVHADIDHEVDAQAVTDLGGFIVRSGSSGHGHVYVPLAWPITRDQHEALCRGLAAKLGGDHKFSDNDLLRPPGTLNYKAQADGGSPTAVDVVWCSQGTVDPRDLADKLGVDFAHASAHIATQQRPPKTETTAPALVDLDKYPRIREAVQIDSGDRSSDTFRIVAVCRRAKLTLAETTFVIRSREDLRARLDERGDDDLLAVWLKLDEEALIADRLVAPSEPAANGADLLDEVLDNLTKYVSFPSDAAAIAVTLWVAATHALPAWQHATRLAVISPQKRCGKSRLLDIVRLQSFNPMSSTDMSAAVIYRSIGDDDTKTPTLFVDEADALFGTRAKAEQNEDLRGLFNAGFQRDRTVWRCVGPNQTPTEFHTFSMAALAAIKSLPDTTVDRSVRIDLKRRGPGDTVARFRLRRDTPPLLKLRDRLTAWVRDAERLAVLAEVEPEMPDTVEDREQDAWEPLIAIADAAGGLWPELARAACVDLCGPEDTDDDGIRLLADIRTVFDDTLEKFLPSTQLVRELKACDESPWADRELTAYRLSTLLKPFGVKPSHGPGKTSRGYWRRDFKDAFGRYARPEVSGRPQDEPDQHRREQN